MEQYTVSVENVEYLLPFEVTSKVMDSSRTLDGVKLKSLVDITMRSNGELPWKHSYVWVIYKGSLHKAKSSGDTLKFTMRE